ncbi:helix-turn-helix domain-containing protein [Streptomyces sp. NPDC048057]|uniref:ArsR/SmtB family transcription factor n=1 Tax=Streptomyces sp. NPDC048057 TaxID=3155628 RepID=UPI0033EDDD8E
MIRIHFTAADFALVSFARRPAPLQELNAALATMVLAHDDDPLLGRWRQRLLRSLPDAARPLADLVPAGRAAGDGSAQHGGDAAARPSPPCWAGGSNAGDPRAGEVLRRAQFAAFEAVVRPVWSRVEDLHRAEFTRYALTVAEQGLGAAVGGLVPGARLRDGTVWECEAPGAHRDLELKGRGLVLQPTFHWTAGPLVAEPPSGAPVLTYPAGPGLPLEPAEDAPCALVAVLGRTRCSMLLLLAEEHTTRSLARRLELSDATVSAHAAALRGAGLITTVRAGRTVLHRRTPLGSLLIRRTL